MNLFAVVEISVNKKYIILLLLSLIAISSADLFNIKSIRKFTAGPFPTLC